MRFWPGRWAAWRTPRRCQRTVITAGFPTVSMARRRAARAGLVLRVGAELFQRQGRRTAGWWSGRMKRVVLRVNLISVPARMTGRWSIRSDCKLRRCGRRTDAWDNHIATSARPGCRIRPYTPPGGKPTTLLARPPKWSTHDLFPRAVDRHPSLPEHHAWQEAEGAGRCVPSRTRSAAVAVWAADRARSHRSEWAASGRRNASSARTGRLQANVSAAARPDGLLIFVPERVSAGLFRRAPGKVDDRIWDRRGVFRPGRRNRGAARTRRTATATSSPTIGQPDVSVLRRHDDAADLHNCARHDPQGQVNVHQSTCMVIPTLAFAADSGTASNCKVCTAENAERAVLPLDAFRCEFMGHDWGVPAELLHYPSGPFKRSEAMGMSVCTTCRFGRRVWATWTNWPECGGSSIDRHAAAWLPYGTMRATWQAVSVDRPGEDAGRGGQYGDRPCQAEVAFDLSALKQAAAGGPRCAHRQADCVRPGDWQHPWNRWGL